MSTTADEHGNFVPAPEPREVTDYPTDERRIVACLKFFRGMPTEEIERHITEHGAPEVDTMSDAGRQLMDDYDLGGDWDSWVE
jgi:hypothetical protein